MVGAVYQFAQTWAVLMEAEIAKGYDLSDIADECSTLADKKFGITGYMYGCAVSILAKLWVHGAELKSWHNSKYGKSDAKGVVNPAILTIKDK